MSSGMSLVSTQGGIAVRGSTGGNHAHLLEHIGNVPLAEFEAIWRRARETGTGATEGAANVGVDTHHTQ